VNVRLGCALSSVVEHYLHNLNRHYGCAFSRQGVACRAGDQTALNPVPVKEVFSNSNSHAVTLTLTLALNIHMRLGTDARQFDFNGFDHDACVLPKCVANVHWQFHPGVYTKLRFQVHQAFSLRFGCVSMSVGEMKRAFRDALEIQSVGKTFVDGQLFCLDESGEGVFKNVKCDKDFVA
jgi:hypothetical protein